MKTQQIGRKGIRTMVYGIEYMLFLIPLYLIPYTSFAQDKKEVSIVLSYFKKADRSKIVTANVKSKNEKRKFTATGGIPVHFYTLRDKEQVALNTISSDDDGSAVIALPKDLPLDGDGFFTVTAKIENEKLYEDAEENIHFKDASLTLKLNAKDTGKTVTAVVTEIGKDGMETPVKDADVKFYVQRLFGVLAASEENTIATSENGEALFSYPKDIPGDTLGNITVVARIEDNDKFGSVESNATVPWGIAVPLDIDPFPRALAQQHPPVPMITAIWIIYGGVWCAFFFVFFQLRKIKTEATTIKGEKKEMKKTKI